MLFWVFWWLTSIVTQYRKYTRGSGYWEMWWLCCWSWSFKPNHGNALVCSMLFVDYVRFHVGVVNCVWQLYLNILSHQSIVPILIFSHRDGTEVYYDLLRCILGCSLGSNVYYEIYLGCLWEPMGFWDLSMMSSVADIELLWMSFDAFARSWRFWYSYCGFTFRYFLSSHLNRTEMILWFMIPWA